jgi:hypothetical protein
MKDILLALTYLSYYPTVSTYYSLIKIYKCGKLYVLILVSKWWTLTKHLRVFITKWKVLILDSSRVYTNPRGKTQNPGKALGIGNAHNRIVQNV